MAQERRLGPEELAPQPLPAVLARLAEIHADIVRRRDGRPFSDEEIDTLLDEVRGRKD